jgi:molybdopterin-guanine dinucleotide biosynthesis protein A
MGADKALLYYAGRLLIERAVELLKAVSLEPHIVGERPDLAAYAPVIEDLHPGCGPLGGIEAALASTTSEWNLFLPVDLPLLPSAFVRYLVERSRITREELSHCARCTAAFCWLGFGNRWNREITR